MNGKISHATRQGKDKNDAWYIRSKYIIKKVRELESITECKVRLELIPTWPSGKVKSYISPDLLSSDIARPSDQTSQAEVARASSFNASLVHQSTPVKNRPSTSTTSPQNCPRIRRDVNICALCGVEYESSADQQINSCWVHCSRNCGYWVHASCCGIFYESDDAGEKNLAKWSKKHFFCPRHFPKEN